MPIILLRGEIVLLEPLADPDYLFPSTKCYPELINHLDIPISVDCHTIVIVVLECLGMAAQFRECNGLCRHCICFQEDVFWSSHDPTTENVPRLKTIHCEESNIGHITYVEL